MALQGCYDVLTMISGIISGIIIVMIYGKVSISGLVLTMIFDLRLRLVSLATDQACWREPGPVSVDPSPSIDLLVVLVLVSTTHVL